jgi:hypothetical protein
MNHPLRRAAFAAAILALATVPGDGSAQQPAPPPPEAGTYTLAQVNEADLPAALPARGECQREITAATLTLAPDRTWQLDAKVRETCGQEVQEKDARQEGTFTTNADGIAFVPTPVDPTVGAEQAAPALEPITSAARGDDGLVVKFEDGTHSLLFRK